MEFALVKKTLLCKKIMPLFNVISKINYQEFDNALANCLREIGN
jgi:uncharacterized protein YajQ (UPF0234 family)